MATPEGNGETLADRLRAAREQMRGRVSQREAVRRLNERLGSNYSRSALSLWELGIATPLPHVLDALAEVYGVNADWLRAGQGASVVRESAYNPARFDLVPYFGALPCGPWEEAAAERTIPLRKGLGGPGRFVFRVAGNSMAPRLNDGDYVIAEAADTASPGEIVVALTQDGEMTVKRLEVGSGGRLVLKPLNPEAKAVEPKTSQIRGRVLMIVPEGAVPDALLSG